MNTVKLGFVPDRGIRLAAINYNQNFIPDHGEAVKIAKDVKRITAPNPSPMTFHGTNSYLIGRDNLALIDPGPLIDAHLEALLTAIGDKPLTHIFVSHTHKDHSPLAKVLQEKTGAKIYAEGPHRPSRELNIGEVNPLHESSDLEFKPDIELKDGEIIDGGDWQIEAIHTPGHTANHCAFAQVKDGILFSADHVMAWSSSIIAPPDGSMRDFMKSLDRLIEREDREIFPGHGGEVIDPPQFLQKLKEHRLFREKSIVKSLARHQRLTIDDMVAQIYLGLADNLQRAAALSVLAHLEDLIEQGAVETEGVAQLDGTYWLK